jgi:hypothetical protein
LEDAMHVLGMTSATRTRGRKASGYVPIKTVEDVLCMALDNVRRPVEGSLEGMENINQ